MLQFAALILAASSSAVATDAGAPRGNDDTQRIGAPTSIDAARISVDLLRAAKLRTGNPHAGVRGPKGRLSTRLTTNMTLSVPGIDSLTNFADEFTAPGFDFDGNPQSVWPYSMVGRAPERGDTTLLSAPIIPVVLDLLGPDGKVAVFNGHPLIFDPQGFVQPVVRSPIFQPFQYLSGFSQFNDAMMRSQFWDRIPHRDDDRISHGDDDYHVLLNPRVKTARHMHVPFGSWFFFSDVNGAPLGALVEESVFASLLFPATVPVDATTPIGAAELAGDMTTRDLTTLLFNNVFLFGGDVSNCCVLGFHSYDLEPGDVHNGNRERRFVMNYSSWISPGLFSFGFEDITALSHEIAETFADPFVDNQTPWWLSVDPFFGFSLCQDNLETGDVIEVLSSNPVFPIQMNGRTYHPQNEALFPWFAFQSPSPAKKGAYSFPDETTLTALSPGPLLPGCAPAP